MNILIHSLAIYYLCGKYTDKFFFFYKLYFSCIKSCDNIWYCLKDVLLFSNMEC